MRCKLMFIAAFVIVGVAAQDSSGPSEVQLLRAEVKSLQAEVLRLQEEIKIGAQVCQMPELMSVRLAAFRASQELDELRKQQAK